MMDEKTIRNMYSVIPQLKIWETGASSWFYYAIEKYYNAQPYGRPKLQHTFDEMLADAKSTNSCSDCMT